MSNPTSATPESEKRNLEHPSASGEVLWKIRPARKDDVPFIMDSWLRSFKRSPYAGVIPANMYTATYSEAVRQLIARGAKLLVAHNPDNDDQIIGFICAEPGVLHAVYVKETFRQNGVAKSLLSFAGLDRKTMRYTYKTYCSRWLGGSHSPDVARRKSL